MKAEKYTTFQNPNTARIRITIGVIINDVIRAPNSGDMNLGQGGGGTQWDTVGRGGGAESSSRLKGEQGGGRVEGMGVWYGYRCGSVLISCVCGSVWTGGWVEGDVGWRWGAGERWR